MHCHLLFSFVPIPASLSGEPLTHQFNLSSMLLTDSFVTYKIAPSAPLSDCKIGAMKGTMCNKYFTKLSFFCTTASNARRDSNRPHIPCASLLVLGLYFMLPSYTSNACPLTTPLWTCFSLCYASHPGNEWILSGVKENSCSVTQEAMKNGRKQWQRNSLKGASGTS